MVPSQPQVSSTIPIVMMRDAVTSDDRMKGAFSPITDPGAPCGEILHGTPKYHNGESGGGGMLTPTVCRKRED